MKAADSRANIAVEGVLVMVTWTKPGKEIMAKQSPKQSTPIDPADVALAEAHGLNAADLSPEDLAELRAAADADAARNPQPAIVEDERPIVREANGCTRPEAISLMIEACQRFGVDYYANTKPQQLLAWRFYPGDDDPRRLSPDAVVIVTAGGVKLKHWDDPAEPMDPDTEERLRRIFHCFREDPNRPGKIEILPLPDDLQLPAKVLTGEVGTDHQYVGGYLRAGGAAAAEEKAKRREQRIKRLWSVGPDLAG